MGNNLIYMRRRLGIMAQPHRESKTGDIVTFTGIKAPLSILAPFSPIQSLNGQSNPYPPGGSPQIWDEEWEAYGSSQIKSKNAIPCEPSTSYYVKCTDKGVTIYFKETESGASISSQSVVSGGAITTPNNCHYMTLYAGSGYGQTYGNNISINYPSTDHDYHPYSNLCPIYGWTGCEVNRTGKNLWDKTSGNVLNMSIASKDGVYVLSNSANARTVYIPCKSNITYTVSKNAGQRFTVAYIKEEPANSVPVYDRITDNSEVTSLTITTGDNAKYLVAYIFNSAYETGTAQDMIDSVQIEHSSSASSYSAYSGTTLSVNWTDTAGTVYGGSLRINPDGTGVLIAKNKMVEASSLSWTTRYTGTYHKTLSTSLPLSYKGYTYVSPIIMAEDYITAGYASGATGLNTPDSKQIGLYWYRNPQSPVTQTLYVVIDKAQSPTGKIVYLLNEPISYTLTAEQVGQLLALNGVNNVWSNANGQITVNYWKH